MILINLVLVDRKTIWRLNKKYRGIDKPTTVLSFYYGKGRPAFAEASAGQANIPIGEIIICPVEAKKQKLVLGELVAHGFKNILSEIPTKKILSTGSS